MTHGAPLPVCLADYERLAQEHLSANAWAYFSGGAADEITVRWNQLDSKRIAIRTRIVELCAVLEDRESNPDRR